MNTGGARGRVESANETIGNALESVLAPGESIWATVPGASGDSLVATDVRLLHIRQPPDGSTTWHAWPFEELSEIRPIGGRPGDAPGRFVIHDAKRSAPLISFAIDPARREDALQAVTIVQLLIARARRHPPAGRPGALREAVDAALARARVAAGGVTAARAGGEVDAQAPSGTSLPHGAEPPRDASSRPDASSTPDASPPRTVTLRSAAPTRRWPR